MKKSYPFMVPLRSGNSTYTPKYVSVCAPKLPIFAWACFCVSLIHPGQVAAQTSIPDAGSIRQQIEQSTKPESPRYKQAETKMRPIVGDAEPGALKVHVQRFEFQGNALLSREQLEEVVSPWLEKDLDFQQLRQIALLVAYVYNEAGYLARVSLPPQDIRNGVVILQVSEATFGKSRIQGAQNRVSQEWLKDFIANAQAEGQAVSSKRIDRALLLLDDIPGLAVTGNLTEGSEAGQTDLLLGVNEREAVKGSVTTDNTGSRTTGVERVLLSLSVNSPLQLGDQFTLSALQTRGSQFQRVGYTVPVGYDGWRVGGHGSHLSYNVMGGDAAVLGLSGTSYSSGLDLSYPWIRSQATNINFTASYDNKHFINDNATTPSSGSNYHIVVYNLSLSGSQMDAWNGGGVTSGSVGVISGIVNLDGSANQSADSSGAATAGRYSKFNVSVNRLQSLDADLSAYVSLNVQQASKNLDSSERMYFGGASGVRAYPTSEGGGSQGQMLSVELRQRLDSQFSLTGFYDRGHVQAFKENAYANGSGSLNSGSAPNNFNLSGYGASITWQPQAGMELRATWSQRVGTNPLANTTTGADTDGTRRLNRMWVNATVNF